jgi:flagellar basal body-associated protein FliL
LNKFIDIAPRKNNQISKPASSVKSEKSHGTNGVYIIIIIILMIVFICSLNSLFSPTAISSNPKQSVNSTPSVNGDNTNTNPVLESSAQADNSSNSSHTDTKTNTNKSNVNIEILNGSGTANTASEVKSYLEQKGYKIANIGTANNIYSSTVIYYKNDSSLLASELAENLSQYQTSTQENPELTGEYDILIVVGQK